MIETTDVSARPDPNPPELDAMDEGEEAPPRGVRWMGWLRWLILVAAGLVALSSWWSYARAERNAQTAQQAPKFQCPMHPQIVSKEPGECPICHMMLEPIAAERLKGDSVPSAPASSVPLNSAPPSRGSSPSSPSSPTAPSGTRPSGTTELQLSFDRIQAAGVRSSLVQEEEIDQTTRVTATLAAPEQGVSEVHVRTPGFVEALHVAQTGVSVAKGQPLFAFYSPELLQAQQELVATRRWVTGGVSGDAGQTTANAARGKLALLGMTGKEIDHLVATGEPLRAVTVHAPQSGFVTKKGVVHGSYVTPEMVLYEIQDLSRVYVIANVFQRDLAAIGLGTEGTFRSSHRPDEGIRAKVDLVYPAVAAEARTTRVRMQIQNPRLAFRPGEYGTVEFAAARRKALVIPRDALVDTGNQTYVFVVEGEGRFVPRTVTLAGETLHGVLVEEGVRAGERVVSGATFLIDSESRLQASLSSTGAPAKASGPANPDTGPDCDQAYARSQHPDLWVECRKCEEAHRGMGRMVADCKKALAPRGN